MKVSKLISPIFLLAFIIIYSCGSTGGYFSKSKCGMTLINPKKNYKQTDSIVKRGRIGLGVLNVFEKVSGLKDSSAVYDFYNKKIRETANYTPREVVDALNFRIESFCFKHKQLDKDRRDSQLPQSSRKKADSLYFVNLDNIETFNKILQGQISNPLDSIVKKKP
ncbi:hypothetical protein BFR04_02600 [Gaetbulibacter sp. 4G1]|nr:hypothetical protein [Gaetbulibacter sp. 4G1]PIA78445.1 hypothetical protein BFR04_02600 [Gaetbulibacter sp. 4G1]